MAKTINPKTSTKFSGDYIQQLIRLGKKGDGVPEFCSKVGICEDTFYAWCRKYPEFNRAKLISRIHAEVWWNKKAKENLVTITTVESDREQGTYTTTHTKFDSSLWKFIVSGRFGRKHRIKKLGKAKIHDQQKEVLQLIGSGELTIEDGIGLSEIIGRSIATEQFGELTDRVRDMENILETQKLERKEQYSPTADSIEIDNSKTE